MASGWSFKDDFGCNLDVFPDNATLSVGAQYGEFNLFQEKISKIFDELSIPEF